MRLSAAPFHCLAILVSSPALPQRPGLRIPPRLLLASRPLPREILESALARPPLAPPSEPAIVLARWIPHRQIAVEPLPPSRSDFPAARRMFLPAFETGCPKPPQLPKPDRKSTRLNSSHIPLSRMPSSA